MYRTDFKKQIFSDSTNNGKCAEAKHKIRCHVNPNVKVEPNENACLDLITQILR